MAPLLTAVCVYGGIISFLMAANIVISLLVNPRMWIQDLPEELQSRIPPKSDAEKRQTIYVLLPFMALMFAGPALAVIDPFGILPDRLDFWRSLLLAYGVGFIFNLVDLLFIDWLLVCTVTPKFLLIPGIEAHELKDYAKHGKDFVKGMVVIAIPGIIGGTAGYFLALYLS